MVYKFLHSSCPFCLLCLVVLIIDGNSEIGAHGRSDIGFLICLRGAAIFYLVARPQRGRGGGGVKTEPLRKNREKKTKKIVSIKLEGGG